MVVIVQQCVSGADAGAVQRFVYDHPKENLRANLTPPATVLGQHMGTTLWLHVTIPAAGLVKCLYVLHTYVAGDKVLLQDESEGLPLLGAMHRGDGWDKPWMSDGVRFWGCVGTPTSTTHAISHGMIRCPLWQDGHCARRSPKQRLQWVCSELGDISLCPHSLEHVPGSSSAPPPSLQMVHFPRAASQKLSSVL